MLFGGVATAQISISLESSCPPYNRADYPYPQSIELRIIAENLDGKIVSPYTGEVFSDRSQTDIEHIVALSEAHNSGLCGRDAATKRQFASDLDNLTLASPSVNRAKSGKNLLNWLPEQHTCWFVEAVVQVKAKYSLSMDFAEAVKALQILTENCLPRTACHLLNLADALNCYADSLAAESPPSLEATDRLESVDTDSNGRITCAEARAAGLPTPVRQEHWAYPYMTDRDGDGTVCE